MQSQVTSLQYYSSSTTSTLVASGVSITQTYYGQQSQVAVFTASGTGYLRITGYTSSSAGSLFITIYGYGNSSLYTVSTTSSTITIPVRCTGTVYLYFTNADTSGYVTAYLSSVYFYEY